ncbi:hypothetical protein DFH28DRAFT_901108 [Melampsora americana]|nr:hypothetical protein DFH28DRAFT_901108 [Melampsora americana]
MISERDIPMQGIHTNNFTESYHRVLKYNFLSRHTLRRPDDTIQVLVDTAEAEFQQTVITTSLGFRPQRSTKYQNLSKGLADSYSDTDLIDLGVSIAKVSSSKWSVSSFTRPLASTYQVSTTPPTNGRIGFINNCTCGHYLSNKSACKHMYVLARQTAFKILETNPEIDDGSSPFVPRGITQPFNLVVHAVTSVHLDSPPPSPPLNPYRSSSGMAQTPSTTGLTSGTFQYAPMVPAPIPYDTSTSSDATSPQPERNRLNEERNFSPTAIARTPTRNPLQPQDISDTSSRWLPVSTHLPAGRMEQISDSYISRLMHDPHHLQSTPPSLGPGQQSDMLLRGGFAPYPTSPFARPPDPRNCSSSTLDFVTYNSSVTNSCTSHVSFGQPTPPRNHRRHHPYRHHDAFLAVPSPPSLPGPPPTQATYEFDPYSLMRHLQSHAPVHNPPPTPNYHPVRTPEVTPAPVTTSQLDGLFQEMEAGRGRSRPPHPPITRHPNQNLRLTRESLPADSDVLPGQYDGLPLTQGTSQPMVTSNTNQSIDTGPSFLTESEVDAMNAAELQFYRKKDDLNELMKTLKRINAEAPFDDEAGILNRATPSLIAAMRRRADDFLTTLRSFNSNNRTYKQRR